MRAHQIEDMIVIKWYLPFLVVPTVGILTGADLYSLCIDPDKGPISGMTGGVPLAVLAAGYLGSILVGSTLILFAFDVTMSKIAWLSIVPLFTICFWFGRTWARVRVAVAVGISISFWFSRSTFRNQRKFLHELITVTNTDLATVDHAMAMRYYILFLGVVSNRHGMRCVNSSKIPSKLLKHWFSYKSKDVRLLRCLGRHGRSSLQKRKRIRRW